MHMSSGEQDRFISKPFVVISSVLKGKCIPAAACVNPLSMAAGGARLNRRLHSAGGTDI
jgi:hypothetical protein